MTRPVEPELIDRLASQYGTPCYVYDAATIRAQIARLRRFDVIRYAQKASSNVHLLRLMRREGVRVDAVSLGELERAVRAGYTGTDDPPGVVFCADLLEQAVLERLIELDVPVNAGSLDMLSQLGRCRPGHRVWLRVNPGFGHGHSRKTNTGGESSKHGIWHESLPEALKRIDEYDLELQGLHMHIGSGSDFENLKAVCEAMVEQVQRLGRDVTGISAGGGLPVPYREGEAEYDTEAHFALWDAARKRIESLLGHPVRLEIEPGRFLVAGAGQLVAEVRATKRQGRNRFVVVNAGFDNLLRPAMYGSFHAISVVKAGGRPAAGPRSPAIVAGPLCESGDVFTQREGGIVAPIELPECEPGDWVVIHDAGAYGAAMASNYNSRPLAPEILLDGGTPRLIRRRQTIDELLALEEV
jgi:diaminopimelate decarboxylase